MAQCKAERRAGSGILFCQHEDGHAGPHEFEDGTSADNELADVARLRDALDHIMRVSQGSMQPTRRLDWITVRAQMALEGKDYEPGQMPRYPRMSGYRVMKENEELREAIRNNAPCPHGREDCRPVDQGRCEFTYEGPDSWLCDPGDRVTLDNDVPCWKRDALKETGPKE